MFSGWWLLWKRWNPFTSPVKIPTQEGIQERLAFCSHYKNLDALKNNPHYEYIQPPVGHFLSSKFGKFEEIYNVGYHHGTTFFCGLKKSGRSEQSKEKTSWLPTSDKARRASQTKANRRDSRVTRRGRWPPSRRPWKGWPPKGTTWRTYGQQGRCGSTFACSSG